MSFVRCYMNMEKSVITSGSAELGVSTSTLQKELKHELVKISWYMRGGLSYSEAMALSPVEREIIAQLVKDNLETTKKSGQPFF